MFEIRSHSKVLMPLLDIPANVELNDRSYNSTLYSYRVPFRSD